MQPRQNLVGHASKDQPPLVCSMRQTGRALDHSPFALSPSAATLDARLRYFPKMSRCRETKLTLRRDREREALVLVNVFRILYSSQLPRSDCITITDGAFTHNFLSHDLQPDSMSRQLDFWRSGSQGQG